MKIITSVVNNPIFIEIQYYTLKKYFIRGDLGSLIMLSNIFLNSLLLNCFLLH